MKNPQEQKLKEIRKIKEAEYGNFDDALNSIGKVWSVLLNLKEPIPGWLVSIMYVGAKLIRTKRKFKKDTYDDAENYLYQAKLMQEKDKNIYREWLK
tara:strand:- start:1803 stop:2093 length:291 start_codon:yes stop_codon:yes gene_type:complete